MREQLERRLGLRARNFYGLSEIIGPGVAAECDESAGAHLNEDHFLVRGDRRRARHHDADQGGTAADPLPRPATSRRSTEGRAPAGARSRAWARVQGRRDDMLILRGVNVYPSEIEHVLLGRRGRRAALRADRLPARRVRRGARALRGAAPAATTLALRVHEALRERTGIGIEVELVETGSLPRSQGKAARGHRRALIARQRLEPLELVPVTRRRGACRCSSARRACSASCARSASRSSRGRPPPASSDGWTGCPSSARSCAGGTGSRRR